MPQPSKILYWMQQLDIFSELLAQKDGQYEHELDLDVILYGRGYTGGLVGPYVRLLTYDAGDKLICEGDWSAQRQSPPEKLSEPRRDQEDQSEDSGQEWDGNSFFVLVDGTLKFEFKGEKPDEYSKTGKIVGAMTLIEGDRAEATISVPAGASATVLEFKRPAIRLLRKYPKFSEAFDQECLEYGLKSALRDVHKAASRSKTGFRAFTSKIFRRSKSSADGTEFQPEQWKEIIKLAQFKVYDKNHVLFRTGEPIDNIFMIKNGWVKLVQRAAEDSLSVAMGIEAGRHGARYLGPGNCLGLEAASEQGASCKWKHTAILQARTELLVVPVAALREKRDLGKAVRSMFSDFSKADEDNLSKPVPKSVVAARKQEIMSGLADGTNLLVMDMDLCIRCGNCSLACHKVHGQSRLVRRGIQIERPRRPDDQRLRHVLAPSVCLHCQDPECLTGCPTGAIGRYPHGQIDINPHTCIGCGDCATQCPYNAITMVARKDEQRELEAKQKLAENNKKLWAAMSRSARLRKSWRQLKEWSTLFYRRSSLKPAEVDLDPPRAQPEKKEEFVAIKCNLCQGMPINPSGARREVYSCQENCPTGALVRVNPREYFTELSKVIGTIFIDQTRAIGRNIHKRDWPARFWCIGGILAAVIVGGTTGWAAYRYGLNTPLPGTTWTLRWLTGVVGLVSVCIALGYFLRKQVYRRRAWPLRYWLQAHVYFSLIATIVFLIHGGWHSGGLLTSALMVLFNLVILTGLFGLACYKLAPRIMTRIEEKPVLIEDLRARRKELDEEFEKFKASNKQLCPLIEEQVRGRFLTIRYLWRQFRRREPLTVLLARARKKFGKKATELGLGLPTRTRLLKAVEIAATLRRVEALIYLHTLLKIWVAPHVAFTVVMLVLLAAHLVQVFVFAVR